MTKDTKKDIKKNIKKDITTNTITSNTEEIKIPKKRGRKKKIQSEDIDIEKNAKPPPKKRGRKPRGGKFIIPNKNDNNNTPLIQNIILHLKCNIQDLNNTPAGCYNIDDNVEMFNLNHNKTSTLVDKELTFKNVKKKTINYKDNNSKLSEKLLLLAAQLHTNEIINEKAACFWCTYDFDNPPIYIPKFNLSGVYHCYGCFCSPECATAFLFKESIDSSVKFERYHLLNYLYSKIYNYNTNIKPAPPPHYMLNKFYGNLSIQEYRKLLTNERLLLVIDKPLTRILPELYDDNSIFLNSGVMSSGTYNIRRKVTVQSKKDIVEETFSGK
jgi:hypothetical protein